MSKPTICLTMIVRNEAHVIRRCLDSVRPIIDSWLIVDTGSSDGTQDIIREHLADLPGEVIERAWVDFAHNRTEALAAARDRADYAFVIDADETLELDPGFEMPALTHDSYNLEVHYGGCTYLRKALARNALPWRYEGVLHEYICCDAPHDEGFVPGLRTIPHPDGARARDPDTYRRDAVVLEKALIDDPDNARYVFYLAQSYRDAGDPEMAIRHYRRRTEMPGWSEEIWYSHYQIAMLLERMQKPWAEVSEAYLAAFEYKGDRAGPLYRIGMHHQAKGAYRTANLFFARAMQIPTPTPDRLFVEAAIYDHMLPLEYAVGCYYVGDHRAAIEVNNALLRNPRLPAELIAQVTCNRRFSLDALFPPPADPGPLCAAHVVLTGIDARLEEVVESVMRQEGADFTVSVLGADAARLPDDPRIAAAPGDLAGLVRAMAPDTVVIALPAGMKLAGRDALARWLAPFADPGCMAAYGQGRHASGALRAAAPAPDAQTFARDPAALIDGGAAAFRAGLAARIGDGGAAVLAAAGYGATRFVDGALTVDVPAPALRAAPAASADLPKISCLMVTYDRLALAKRSMDCFARQSYPNRELVVVTNGADTFCNALRAHAGALGIEARFTQLPDEGQTLGMLRNVSLDSAGGEIVCQWDDDDCNHPERLTVQAAHMFGQNARACLMTDHLQFLQDAGLVVWVDWTLGGRERVDQLLPGTVMMHRDPRFRYPETGQYASRGEDSMFLSDLYSAVPVASLVGHGHLYLYTYHGRNTFSQEHHHHLSTYSRDAADVAAAAPRIREALSHYPIEKPVTVGGRDGPAFVI